MSRPELVQAYLPIFRRMDIDEERGFSMSHASLRAFVLSLPLSLAAFGAFASDEDSYSERTSGYASGDADTYSERPSEYSSREEEEDTASERASGYSSRDTGDSEDQETSFRRRDWMRVGERRILTPNAIARSLRDSDYTNVRRVVYTGGLYTAAATDHEGRQVTLQINARSGEVIVVNGQRFRRADWRGDRPSFTRATRRIESREVEPLDRADVRRALMRDGYRDLGWIREVGNVFIVKARDVGGERVELTIDGLTGEVIDTDYI
jgi:hypothetical protein